MDIVIIGTGNAGTVLGRKLRKAFISPLLCFFVLLSQFNARFTLSECVVVERVRSLSERLSVKSNRSHPVLNLSSWVEVLPSAFHFFNVIPENINSFGDHTFTGFSFLTDHPLVVHFIHRNLAYLISFLILLWTWKAYKINGTKLFRSSRLLPLLIVLLQVLIGILTVLNAINKDTFLWLGIAHQFIAMLLLLSLVFIIYIIRSKPAIQSFE